MDREFLISHNIPALSRFGGEVLSHSHSQPGETDLHLNEVSQLYCEAVRNNETDNYYKD